VNESKLRPKVVLWWGIGLTLAGMLLTTSMPFLGHAMTGSYNTASGVDQGLLTGLSYIGQLIAQTVPPLGVALIGASVVMAYLGRLLTPARERVAVAAGVADED